MATMLGDGSAGTNVRQFCSPSNPQSVDVLRDKACMKLNIAGMEELEFHVPPDADDDLTS